MWTQCSKDFINENHKFAKNHNHYICDMMKLSIIGYGNVGEHLTKAFYNQKGIELIQIFNRSEIADDQLPGKIATTSKIASLFPADIFLLCLKDDIIEDIAHQIPHQNAIIAHTSGSLGLLKGVEHSAVFYPLQTFNANIPLDYQKIPFCLEAKLSIDFKILEKLVGQLGAKAYPIDSQKRQYLHLAAVFVANFTNFCYQQGHDICKDNNIPFDILHPLIEQTAQKIKMMTPKEAQTGPASRGDLSTMNRHLSQLNDPEKKEIYQLISQAIQEN
jgi:predicted short-subunit dehydrogenase-like oxidoreductase (DUF2520 family)